MVEEKRPSGVGARGGIIPAGITRADVLGALKRLDAGEDNGFGPSTGYDLVYEGKRYPPKAVLALAAERLAGEVLDHAKFTGGKDSQCNRVLAELDFEIVEKAEEGSKEAWRLDPDSARAVFDEAFLGAAPGSRGRWEAFLGDSLAYALTTYPDRTVAVLEPHYVSTTVGMVRCHGVRQSDDFIVLLDRKAAPAGTRWTGGKYVNAPGCEEAEVPRDASAALLASIRASHLKGIDACGKAHGGNRQRWRAHSAGVLRYLEAALGRTLPDPSYAKQSQAQVGIPSSDIEAEAAEELLQQRTDIGATEKKTLINARRGQGVYRKNLEQIEKGCRVSGVKDGRFLRASHIKPWAKSDDFEKLDGHNGLLLTPNADHLFDGGLISFSDSGDLLISKKLPEGVLASLGMKRGLNVGGFNPEQCVYLGGIGRRMTLSQSAIEGGELTLQNF